MKRSAKPEIALAPLIAGAALLVTFLLLADTSATVEAWPVTPMPSPTPPTARPPGPAFVKPGGTGGWCLQDDPCGSIQYAIDQSEPGNGDTIYIAGGTYTSTGPAVITITKSITLYGGWDGSTAVPVVRDPEQYPTVLDGEGQRRVVYIIGAITSTMDGLTIIRGNASNDPYSTGRGGGIYSDKDTTPIIANCIISGNVAYTGTVLSGVGGGIHVFAPLGTAVITGNLIISNVASLSGRGVGGGIRLLDAPNAQVINNTVLSNTAAISASYGYGGGIAVEVNSQEVVLSGNRIEGNVALARSNGYGEGYGGGVDIASPSVLITGNVVISNTATVTGGRGFGGGIALLSGGNITVTGNSIEHNVAQAGRSTPTWSYGGGIHCYHSSDVLIGNNTLRLNTASAYYRGGGGGIALWWYCDGATIVGNRIEGNLGAAGLGDGQGGGVYVYASHDVRLEANRVLSNTASTGTYGGSGGGLYIRRDTRFTMTNNIIAGNDASIKSGGMALEGWSTGPITGTLAHNTFAANDRGDGEGRIGIYLKDAPVTLVLTNNLIYSHTYGVYAVASTTATLYNTLFYAHSNGDTGGDGVIVNTDPITGQDPLLDADYHLQKGSPAIDAGTSVPWLTTDIDGDPRPSGPAPDIGADEFPLNEIYLPLVVKEYP